MGKNRVNSAAPSPSRPAPVPPPPVLTLRALATGGIHPAVSADAEEAAEEPVFAGGVKVPQPDRFPPAVVNVRTGVGQRQRDGGGGGETEQRQGGRARLHGAERRGEARRGAERRPGAVCAGCAVPRDCTSGQPPGLL